MIKAKRETSWRKFQKLVNSQICQVGLYSETSEKLQQLRKDLEKSNGNRSHLEFRLISYCTLRILQLSNCLWTQEETEMCNPEDKEAIKREIRDSLLNLELRLGKYTDEVIYRHFNENDRKFREEEERLFDTIEHFKNQETSVVDVEIIKSNVYNVCERAQDMGYNIGELTLSNDMAEILSTIKLLSRSFSAANTRNSTKNSNSQSSAGLENITVCPCENQPSEDKQDCSEIVDFSSDYTGSEQSAEWTTARATALRIKNIPKLDFQFLDSDQEIEEFDRKYCDHEVSCWSSRTSSCITEELQRELDYSCVFKTIDEKTEVSSVYESLSPSTIPSDIDSEFRSSSRASSYSQAKRRTSVRLMDHPHCYGSFTLISRNQETAVSDGLGSFTMDDLSGCDSNAVNYGHSTGFVSRTVHLNHRCNTLKRTLNTITSSITQTIRMWIPFDPSYWNTMSLCLIVVFCLLLLRISWVYFCCNGPTRNILRYSFYPELDNISFLLEFLYRNMEIKHHGLPPV
ncbi:hypothetical protein LOTGIDRAFT_234370 [Lottia gigantea]|uniref:KASH domain-containing protein n=1 Tax=Lottia gigantea TaxID=225164 RepID=V3ZCG8_LOTGI|nr:hypothetical protein LOTGIDRAFT_234370 [Lottia gigantea]ESO88763.1 hypothetical protein LOTGIDRAFT_234370 [Lottia gigantea]